MPYEIYVTRKIPKPGLDMLDEYCDNVEINSENRVLRKEELLGKVKGKDGILCLLTDKIDKVVIEAADKAKVIANYAVGFDNIDVGEATEKGIIVTNTPGVLTDATADLAWALLFSIARRIAEADKFTREGKFVGWEPMLLLGRDVTGATLGIIGAGRIGTALALKSQGFKMKVRYCDKDRNELIESKLQAKKVDKEELLSGSDFISVHVPHTDETFHLIGKNELKMMKKDACLINTSRGPVIDEKALVEALKNKEIAGAALDVYEDEPQLAEGLAGLDNVIIVPHIGSATINTRTKMAVMAAENLIMALKGERPKNIVNEAVLNKA